MKKVITLFLAMVMLLGTASCSVSPEEAYAKAREAFEQEDYDDAYKYAKIALKDDESNEVMRTILSRAAFFKLREYYLKHGDQEVGSKVGGKHTTYKGADVSLSFANGSMSCYIDLEDYYIFDVSYEICVGEAIHYDITASGVDINSGKMVPNHYISMEIRHNDEVIARIDDSEYDPAQIGEGGFNSEFNIKKVLPGWDVYGSVQNLQTYMGSLLWFDGYERDLAADILDELAGWFDEFFEIYKQTAEKATSISLYDIGFTRLK